MPARRKISLIQQKILADFMSANLDMVHNYANNSIAGNSDFRRKWDKLTLKLNSIGDGDHKTVMGWKNYWKSWKNKIKSKAAARRAAAETGGGCNTRPLNNIELVVLGVIGDKVMNEFLKHMPFEISEDECIKSEAIEAVVITSSQQPVPNISIPDALPVQQPACSDTPAALPRPGLQQAASSDIPAAVPQPVLQEAAPLDPLSQHSDTSFEEWLRQVEERRLQVEERRAQAEERRAVTEEAISNTLNQLLTTMRQIADRLPPAI